MVALLNDIAVTHDENHIGLADGRQAVSDDKACAALPSDGQTLPVP